MRNASGDSPLLTFANVGRRVRDGARSRSLLCDVSFELSAAETAGLYGARNAGKSTLLRLACAIELADAGAVVYDGHDLARLSRAGRARLLREQVALVVEDAWLPQASETALGRIVTALGGTGLTLREARRRGLAALDRFDVAGIAADPAVSLERAQRARVELACAIAREPRLLLVDEPAPSPNVLERERLCAAIRGVAEERAIALLIASEDVAALQGLGTLMSISAGEVCSTSGSATLVSLAGRRAGASR
ncbi:MAG: ATP-binding cassette domain-containing protein [Solirubrobacteraceae bacterium]